jgi:hypothetical protein
MGTRAGTDGYPRRLGAPHVPPAHLAGVGILAGVCYLSFPTKSVKKMSSPTPEGEEEKER